MIFLTAGIIWAAVQPGTEVTSQTLQSICELVFLLFCPIGDKRGMVQEMKAFFNKFLTTRTERGGLKTQVSGKDGDSFV